MSNTKQQIRILHLEDDPDDAELVRHAIKKSGINALWTNVTSKKDFLPALQDGALSIILADASLPGFDGNAALSIAREKRPEVPFVFVSGQMQEDAAIEALRSGATDYVFKTNLQRLGPVVRRALEEAAARRAQREFAQAAERLQDCTNGVSGQEYFEQLLHTLADVLRVRHAFIGVITSPAATRIRTVAWWTGSGFAANFEYDLSGTPCANVVAGKECIFIDGVSDRFSGDRLLVDKGIASYHGIPLSRRDGTPLGLLSVFDTAPMDSLPHLRPLLGLFGGRAAMEIERLEAVERLHESNARLSMLLQSSPLAIYTRDRDGLLTSWNPAAEQMYGWKAEEVIGKPLPSVPDASRAESDALRVRLLAGESFIKHETRRRKRDGTPIDVDAFLAPLRGSAGEITGIIAVVADITERKRAEETLRETQRRLTTLMANLPGMVYRCANDPQWTLEFVSNACETLTGYPAADLVGNRKLAYADLILPADRQAVWDSVQRAVAAKTPFALEYRITTAAGAVKWVWEQGSGVYGEDGDLIAIEGLVSDITGRKQVEAERMRLAAIVENSNDAIIGRTLDGVITSWNAGAELLLGHTAAEAIGKPATFILLPTRHHVVSDNSARALRGEFVPAHETKRIAKDGRLTDVLSSHSPIRDEHGTVIGISIILHDITALKQTQQENARLATIVESSQDAIVSLDLHGIIQTWNPGAERLFNCSTQDAVDRNIEFIFPKHRLHEIGNRRSAALAGRGTTPLHTERLTRDGRCIPVSVSTSALRDISGNVTGIALIYRDMTEQAIAEAALRESEEYLQATFEQAAVGMAFRSLDPRNPRWLRVNQKLCDILGYTRDELLQLTSVDISLPDEHADAIAYNEQLLSGKVQGYSREKRYLRKDGTFIWVNLTLSAVRGADGRPTHAISVIEDISERKLNEERLMQLAHYDQLTSLPNRVLLQDRLQMAIAQAGRSRENIGVLLLDLDRFKLVNDTLGHDAGDILLQQVTGRLQETLRSGDIVARLGGDEFIAILTPLRSPEDASVVAQKMLDRLAQPFTINNQQVFVSASIGITLYPEDSDNVTALIKNADAAMYRAKELGRNGYQFFTPELNVRSRSRIKLEAALRKAAVNGEFSLHYQPRVNLATGSVQGVEALMRWERPGQKMVSPGEFVPVLEDTGLILPVSEQLFGTACRQLRQWHDAGLSFVTMAVNLSARQFQSEDIAENFRRIADAAGVDMKCFEFEITESLLVHSPEQAAAILQRLKDSGATVAIDDFGTGYSSLSYLTNFPIDCVKIDRSFVENITTNPSSAAVALAVIDMAHRLGLRTVAEGVETEGQLRYLAANKCDEMQGYYFSRPLPAAACTTLLEAGTGLSRNALGREFRDSCLLLIDDEPDDLAALERTFRRENYRILTATNAGDALQLLASHRVGVVICDQRMPGIAGTELLSRIRQMHPQTVRMALSGYTDLNAVLDAVNVGAVSKFLTKPWDDNQLRELVKEAFRLFELGAAATRQA
jgi:diguanylate cyclase (GGDEF)-like protein/PAS domain S-box-containing protein